MNTFLHFIGANHYTIDSFCREALRHGITRRISLAQLKQLQFDDRVVLAMRDGASSLIFGEFVIDRISGLTPEGSAAVKSISDVRLEDPGGRQVQRGCGWYVTGPTFLIDTDTDLQAIARALEQCANPGKVMVGGELIRLPTVGARPVRMRDLAFTRGFRPFDYDEWSRHVAELDGEIPRGGLRGQFYVHDGEPAPALPRERVIVLGCRVQQVKHYEGGGAEAPSEKQELGAL